MCPGGALEVKEGYVSRWITYITVLPRENNSLVGRGAMLQAEKSRVRAQMG
jgi:hypothetical protein